eukprot:g13873.t1
MVVLNLNYAQVRKSGMNAILSQVAAVNDAAAQRRAAAALNVDEKSVKVKSMCMQSFTEAALWKHAAADWPEVAHPPGVLGRFHWATMMNLDECYKFVKMLNLMSPEKGCADGKHSGDAASEWNRLMQSGFDPWVWSPLLDLMLEALGLPEGANTIEAGRLPSSQFALFEPSQTDVKTEASDSGDAEQGVLELSDDAVPALQKIRERAMRRPPKGKQAKKGTEVKDEIEDAAEEEVAAASSEQRGRKRLRPRPTKVCCLMAARWLIPSYILTMIAEASNMIAMVFPLKWYLLINALGIPLASLSNIIRKAVYAEVDRRWASHPSVELIHLNLCKRNRATILNLLTSILCVWYSLHLVNSSIHPSLQGIFAVYVMLLLFDFAANFQKSKIASELLQNQNSYDYELTEMDHEPYQPQRRLGEQHGPGLSFSMKSLRCMVCIPRETS